MVSVYGALNGFVMTGIRVPYVMGYLGYLPFSRGFRSLNRGGVPWLGGCLQFIVALLMILSGTFDTITNMLVVVIWFFYMLCFIAVFILRKREPELARPYRVPGYPIVPIIALAGGVFIVLTTAITQPLITVIGILVTAAGIPVYRYQKVRHRITLK